jgi:hypothetical protein
VARFSEQEKATMARLFGRFYTPSQVAEAVSEAWGRPVDRRETDRYNPANARCSAKWLEVAAAERARFLKEEEEQPLFHRPFRLAILQRTLEHEGNRNPVLRLAILEQAAKEVGGKYTNIQEVTDSSNNPVRLAMRRADELTTEEAVKILGLSRRRGGLKVTEEPEP